MNQTARLLGIGTLDHAQARRLDRLGGWWRAANHASLGRSSLNPSGTTRRDQADSLHAADMFRRSARRLAALDQQHSRKPGWHMDVAIAIVLEDTSPRECDRLKGARNGACAAAIRRVADVLGEADLLHVDLLRCSATG